MSLAKVSGYTIRQNTVSRYPETKSAEGLYKTEEKSELKEFTTDTRPVGKIGISIDTMIFFKKLKYKDYILIWCYRLCAIYFQKVLALWLRKMLFPVDLGPKHGYTWIHGSSQTSLTPDSGTNALFWPVRILHAQSAQTCTERKDLCT